MFEKINKELPKVTDWHFANKLFINTSKKIFFHKQTDRNNVPLKLLDLKFNNNILKIVTKSKFLGETKLKNEIKIQKSELIVLNGPIKISKNNGVLLKGNLQLNKKCLSVLYFSCIYSYKNYDNIAWSSPSQNTYWAKIWYSNYISWRKRSSHKSSF